jgi:magnesium chelatase family protein
MVGGGRDLLPGLVTQAHLGVLFLDELAEFDRGVLDALRQPLEDGTVEIVRAHGHVRYPARLQLIAAMNPCRCRWHGSEDRRCLCGDEEADRYVRRVSGPLLDRIDMRVSVPRVTPDALLDEAPGESSAVVAARIASARARALARSGVTNGRLAGAALLAACQLDRAGRRTLGEMAAVRAMTARGIHRSLRVARTIADLAGHEAVEAADLTAAVTLREDGAGRLAA